jgi:DNA-3-methyladenine glycosylase
VALGITLGDDGVDLSTGEIRLEPAQRLAAPVASGPRTGVSGPGGSDEFPWRFWIDGDPTVSPYRPSAPRPRARRS